MKSLVQVFPEIAVDGKLPQGCFEFRDRFASGLLPLMEMELFGTCSALGLVVLAKNCRNSLQGFGRWCIRRCEIAEKGY